MNHSQNISPITCAELEWQQVDGVDIPVSKQFGDVYFSKANGLLETRHVFLNGNDLSERLTQLADGEQFTVGETGFGTGLNFLALWQLWQNVRPNNNSRLHFISVEKYPLSKADLARALASWDELAPLSKRLLGSYPFALAGCHRLRFDDERISLDVWFGDASECFPLIQNNHPINAWFLDGFAPSCNPELWQEQIFKHIMRLSAQGTTFASFSVAGVLKRALQSYGVEITRPKGFGHKREMLKAIWKNTDDQIQTPNHAKSNLHNTLKKVAIIGAGIAGLATAWTLAQRGIAVTLFEQEQPLAGGSGNPLAMLNPKLCPMDKVATHLMTTSWQYALRFYQQFDAFQAMQIEQTHDTNSNEKKINDVLALQDYPNDILEIIQSESGHHDTAQSKILLKQAGVISPHQFAEQVLAHPLISLIQKKVTQIKISDDQNVRLYDHEDTAEIFYNVIVCNAMDLNRLLPNTPRLKPIRGQVTWTNINGTDFYGTNLQVPFENIEKNTAYSFGGYACPMQDNQTQQLIFGASFLPNDDQTDLRIEDHQHNYQLLQHYHPELTKRISDNPQDWQGRAALRAQTADYLPLVGRYDRVSPNIYLFAGLGSKGFLFSPLCAELVVSQMLNETLPVPSNLVYLLRPNRFKIKPLD